MLMEIDFSGHPDTSRFTLNHDVRKAGNRCKRVPAWLRAFSKHAEAVPPIHLVLK